MVFFGSSNSAKPLEGDAPRLLRMTPLHHSFRVARDRRYCGTTVEEDAQSDAGSTASAPGYTGTKDLSLLNKGLSQRWRRLRRRCASFTSGSPANSYPSPEGNQHRESLLDLDSSCDSPVIRRGGFGTNSASIVITPKRIMSPSKGADLFEGPDALSLDGNYLSPKPPKSKSSNDNKIFPDVQQLLRTKFNRIHAGLRKRRAVSIHEVQSNRVHHPIFYVPSPLVAASSHNDGIHSIDEGEDENGEETGHFSLPPFAFRDSKDESRESPKKTFDLSSVWEKGSAKRKDDLNSHVSSLGVNGSSSSGSSRPLSSSLSSRVTKENEESARKKDRCCRSTEIHNRDLLVYCDKWTSPHKSGNTNFSERASDRFSFVQTSNRTSESVQQSEASAMKFRKARLSENSKPENSSSRFSVSEPSRNPFIIGSPMTNRFATNSMFTDSGPSSLPYEIHYENRHEKKGSVSHSTVENLPPKGDPKTLAAASLALRNRTRSQSPMKKGKKHHQTRSVWIKEEEEDDNGGNPEKIGIQKNFTKAGSNREKFPLKSSPESADEEEKESKFCTLPRHGKGSGFSILTVTFTKGPGQKGLGFSIVGGRDSPKGNMGIYVKTIFPTGQAAESGTLKEGDEILAVNQKPFHGLSHQEAINVFKEIKHGAVQLHVGRRLYKKR